jgi:hypothetical protein
MSEGAEEALCNTDPNREAWRGAIADALWYFAGEGVIAPPVMPAKAS